MKNQLVISIMTFTSLILFSSSAISKILGELPQIINSPNVAVPERGNVNLTGFPLATNLDSSDIDDLDPQLIAAFEEVIQNHLETYNMVGISASVIIPDGSIWCGAVGNSSATEPMTPDHKMDIGSLTKSFTAAAILKLREEGLLNLDDTIGTWIVDNPNIPGEVTILQILNHTSGIYNFMNNQQMTNALFANLDSIWNPYHVLTNYVNAPVFAPGTDWGYSNTNYIIAGVIIEMVTGNSYQNVVREYFLEPLELDNTYLAPFENAIDPLGHMWYADLITGDLIDYTSTYGSSSNSSYTSSTWAAGAMYSNSGDLGKWMKALITGEVLNAESQELLMNFIPTGQGVPYNYGLALQERIIDDVYAIGHTGTLFYRSASFYFPEAELMISFTTNDGLYNANVLILIKQLYDAYEQWSTTVSVPDNHLVQEPIVYPNPADDHIFIKTLENEGFIQLYDISGKLVYSDILVSDHTKIDVSQFAEGLFYLNISTDSQHYSRKIILYR